MQDLAQEATRPAVTLITTSHLEVKAHMSRLSAGGDMKHAKQDQRAAQKLLRKLSIRRHFIRLRDRPFANSAAS